MLDQPTPKLVRVGVKNRGCAGLAYHLEYVDKAGKFDEVVEQDGTSHTLYSMNYYLMDYIPWFPVNGADCRRESVD